TWGSGNPLPLIFQLFFATRGNGKPPRAWWARDASASWLTTLIGEEAHRLLFAASGALTNENDFLVRKGVGRVAHGRVDVLTCQSRVAVQQVGLRSAVAQLAQDQLHRNPSPTDDRLAQHDFWVDFDPIGQCHLRAPHRSRTPDAEFTSFLDERPH